MRTGALRQILRVVLVAALPAAGAALTEPLSFLVSDSPLVRFYWTELPEALMRGRLDTGGFSNIEPEDYLGPDACASCHQDKWKTWQHHRHRWMNAPVNEATVLGDFDGASMDYFGGTAHFDREVGEGGPYRMRLRREDVERTYQITQTIGSRFFQYYVGIQIRGPEPKRHALYSTEHVLPFGYWLDYEGWVPVVHVEKTREGEPSLVDGMQRDPFTDPVVYDYAQSCSQCHTTLAAGDWLIHRQPSFPPSPRGFDFNLGAYVRDNHPDLLPGNLTGRPSLDEGQVRRILLDVTRKRAPVFEIASGVSCETCHYGGRVHVESGGAVLPRMFPVSPRLFIEGRDHERELARNSTNQNWTCSRCHIGDRFEYAAGMSTWNSTEFTDLAEGACFFRGDERSIRCIDCHDPHVTTGESWSRTPDEDDALCLRCHEGLAPEAARSAHTRHPAGSTGGRCMNCHMPRINEGLQDMVRTHTIFSPTNAKMIEANQPNACNMCHVDRSIDWALEHLEAWYGASYSEAEMAASYDPEARRRPAAFGWLESWHPTTQMVGVDVLAKARAEWALPALIDKLDSEYLLVRQFAEVGIEEMLGVRLEDHGYRFYQLGEERRAHVSSIRQALLGPETRAAENRPRDPLEGQIRHYRQFLRQRPDSANGHYHLANALLQRGRVDEAITHYREAMRLAPEMAAAHSNLGIAYREKGAHEQALAAHERAVALEPAGVDFLVAFGATLDLLGRGEAAKGRYREALRVDPDSVEAHYNLGNALARSGDADGAIERYQAAIRIRPGYAEALNNLGILLRARGDSEAALASFQAAATAARDPDLVASARGNLGWALKLAGRLDEAGVEFEWAIEASETNAPALVGLAWILAAHPIASARDPGRAVRLAEQAAELVDGENVEALDALGAAYASAGRFEEAVAAANRALALADAAVADSIRGRLALYRAGSAYVERR